jgi:serine O-acetyltransferase
MLNVYKWASEALCCLALPIGIVLFQICFTHSAPVFQIGELYEVYFKSLGGIELLVEAQIANGLRMSRGPRLVAQKGVRLGEHCLLRQGVTIAKKRNEQVHLLPAVVSSLEFGVGAILIGNFRIREPVI